MAKDPALGIRLEPMERAALEAAARSDQRALSAMGRRIIVDWLRLKGWLVSEDGEIARQPKRRLSGDITE